MLQAEPKYPNISAFLISSSFFKTFKRDFPDTSLGMSKPKKSRNVGIISIVCVKEFILAPALFLKSG